LEREIRDFASERGKRLKAAQDKLKKGKSDLEGAKKTLKAKEQALQEAIAEAEAAGHESETLKVKAASVKALISSLESEVADLEAQAAAAKKEAAVATKELSEKRERMRECDVEIRGLEKERDRLMRGAAEIEGEIKKIETRAKHKAEERAKYMSHMSKLEEQYKWVLTEKEAFGRPSSDYDFKKNDPKKVHAQYEEAEKRLEELKGKVNHQCMAKLEKAESECKGLMEKWTIVENDKKSLKLVIEELDEKKKAALKATWLKVNGDFGAIFSTLLPGTKAKLEPSEGASFLEGLEMRVAFGDVWKESLTELSGGQRSLLALSLILALCR
jgi:structural maintenance of chromosome 2